MTTGGQYDDGIARCVVGDVRAVLATLDAESVQCVVTSPPYWGLRDYGNEGQLGLEATPALYVEHMVAVFREVRRVLRGDGTLWLNLGDCYAASLGQRKVTDPAGPKQVSDLGSIGTPSRYVPGLKPKDLVGMPWRLAFALQADGWYLRCDVIWSKPNPMPESVTDRPTKAHEYLFLLTKQARYFYDAEAIKEAAVATNHHDATGPSYHAPGQSPQTGNRDKQAEIRSVQMSGGDRTTGFNARWDASEANGTAPFTRNKRSVWTIATQPYPEAHFATFPEALVEPCILAGSRPEDTVLDPFAGSGTTLSVAKRLNRNAIGIELNPAYLPLIAKRCKAEGAQLAMPA